MDDILKYAVENGIIDLSYVQEQIEMNKRKEYLEKHPYSIWQGKDEKWYTYLPDKEKGRVLKRRTSRIEIENAIIDYWKIQSENPVVREVFEEWNDRKLELKKISKATHLRNTQIFDRHYKEFGKRRIKSVDAEMVSEFLEEQIPMHGLTAKAFANLKTITRGFLKRAKKRKLIDFNVEELFQELDVSETDFKKVIKEDYEEVFNEEEMPVMIEYLKSDLDLLNMGILLMFVTGIRIGEVVTLKHSDLDGNILRIRRTETRYKEDGKYVYDVKEFPKTQAGVRTVVIPDDFIWLVNRLQEQNPFDEYIFFNSGHRIRTPAMRMRLKRNCRKLNIYQKSPHKIRKTYGTILLDNHIDNQLILGQMGHTDILCTENHYHRNRRNISAKSKVISSIPEFKDVLTK